MTPAEVLVLLLLTAAYWAPSFVAWRRHIPAKVQVVLINLFLGWTLVGWVVALVWAFRPVSRPAGG